MSKVKNKLMIKGNEVEVFVKEITFFDVQKVAPSIAKDDLDFSFYWQHAFENWLSFNKDVDINSLTPDEGNALASLLPHPTKVVEWITFREAGSIRLNGILMENQ